MGHCAVNCIVNNKASFSLHHKISLNPENTTHLTLAKSWFSVRTTAKFDITLSRHIHMGTLSKWASLMFCANSGKIYCVRSVQEAIYSRGIGIWTDLIFNGYFDEASLFVYVKISPDLNDTGEMCQ